MNKWRLFSQLSKTEKEEVRKHGEEDLVGNEDNWWWLKKDGEWHMTHFAGHKAATAHLPKELR